MQETKSYRHRVNFSVTSKGIVTCDVTYEAEGSTRTEVVKEAGKLFVEAQAVAEQRTKENMLNPLFKEKKKGE